MPVQPAHVLPPEADKGAVVEGRRQATILFTDLSGFTELSVQLDAEDLHAIVQAYFDRVEQIVEGLGGSIERYVGDAVMAVFGARRAHGDDALRAVRAGLDIQAAMPALSQHFNRHLASVVGIASGEIVVMAPRADYAAEVAIVGVAVNLAARVESIGAPGQLLIEQEVHRQVRGRVQARSLGQRILKGIDQPVHVWRVESLIQEPIDSQGTLLVGRQFEMEWLQEHLLKARSRRQAQTLLLRGEAGLGKTRLIDELGRTAATAGWGVHRARFLDFGLRRGAEGLSALVCSLLDVDVLQMSVIQRHEAAQNAVAAGWIGAHRLPQLHVLMSVGQNEMTRKAFDAMDATERERRLDATVAELVDAVARHTPLLMLVEDIHWAEPAELQRLARLVHACRDSQIVLVLSTRPQTVSIEHCWSMADVPLHSLDLMPLQRSDLERLCHATDLVEPEVVQGCITRCGGNPLFLEQLLQHVIECRQHDSVPASIRSLMLARLDLLAPAQREAVQIAAVFGQRFETAALCALLGVQDFDVTDLIRSQMLCRDGAELRFAHALVHEAAYASLLRRNARDLHQRAATWYAERDLLLHAGHLERAESPQAPHAYLVCAAAEIEAGHLTRARSAIERGLAVATAQEDRVNLILQLGQLLHDAGQIAEAHATFDQACRQAAQDAQKIRAYLGLAAAMRLSDDLPGATAALDQAQQLSVHQEERFAAELARLHYLRGSLCFPRGDITGCHREHTLALAHARRANLPRAEADALSGLGDAAYAEGRMRTANKVFSDCMTLCAKHGFGRIEAANRFMVATVRIYLTEFEPALEDALESADLAQRVGHQRAEIISRLTAGWILINLGRLDQARQQVTIGLAVTEKLGAARFKPFLLESQARIELAEGNRSVAFHTASTAWQLVQDGQLQRFIGPWVLATLALCTDDPEQRNQSLQAGELLLEQGCVRHNHLNFHVLAMLSAARWGDITRLQRSAQALKACTEAEPCPWADFHVDLALTLAESCKKPPAESARTVASALLRLRAQAEAMHFHSIIPVIDQGYA
ncbi:MAG: adenylate/guanylate cyclase domain-containing protein [Leptothrix ochracea]|uniref:AAA family ATPase n=1 Tax=Leptothrix ochracea TaxID=735331 RepID=UPI0034E20286